MINSKLKSLETTAIFSENIILIIAFVLCSINVQSQISYLEIQNHKSTIATYGQIDISQKRGLNKLPIRELNLIQIDEYNLTQITKDLQYSPQKYADDTLDILIYIHCMWGGVNFFESLVLRKMQPHFFVENGRIDKVFPVIWHSGISYKNNLKKANKIGETLGEGIWQIMEKMKENDEKQAVRFHLLCHSMGHQVLRGIMRKRDLKEIEQPIFSEIIFAAADLDNLAFEQGNDFEFLPQITERITYFINENDRPLKVSSKKNKTNRLGKTPIPESIAIQHLNIKFIDAKDLDDVEGLTARISGHSYFFASPTIRKKIEKILNDRMPTTFTH